MDSIDVLESCAVAIWEAKPSTLFDILEGVPSEKFDDLMRVSDRAFALALHDVLGLESTLDREVFVAKELEKGATRVIHPVPYLFEALIRRQYGEPEIISGVSQEQVILHSIVGAALLRPNDLETLLSDATDTVPDLGDS